MVTQFRDQIMGQTQKYLIEALIFALLGWYIVRSYYGSNRGNDRVNSDEASEKRINEWEPEPIVPDLKPEEKELLSRVPVIEHPGRGGRELLLADGGSYLDMASFNFQGLTNLSEFNEVAIEKLRTHGVGTCGPRGFYGTMDVHLDLESKISKIFKTDDTILYSQTLSSITSTLYAFIRKGDFVIADEKVSLGHQKGFHTSSQCNYLRVFSHNDMEDLEAQMAAVAKQCKNSNSNARKILVVEAIYKNTGEICPLKTVVELKEKYDFFLFLDETHSFGVLGDTGLGAIEYWGLDVSKVDLIIGCFSTTFASSGGFVTGKAILIDYLHLNGKSYTFSASTPSLLVAAATHAISYFLDNSAALSRTLRENSTLMHNLLQPLSGIVDISKSVHSPIIHIIPKDHISADDVLKYEMLLSDIILACKKDGVLFTFSKYDRLHEMTFNIPSIRIAVSSAHSKQDLIKAADSLKKHISMHLPLTEPPRLAHPVGA